MTFSIDPLKSYFSEGHTKSYEFRLRMLEQLEKLVTENVDAICDAIYADLRKPKQEALVSELAVTTEEIRIAKKKLKKWMKPQRATSPLVLIPSKSKIHYDPLGVVLIIGTWNYPFQIIMGPLVGAIAAGNCAVLKPSEFAEHTSRLTADLIKKYFPSEYITVVEGGVPETTALLNTKFNHIFFTGSTQVGRIIMQEAAKNLIPVTLELGGKSPTVVCDDADLDLAARRIVWGKFYNAGQTCICPDYLYVHESVSEKFLKRLKENIAIQFGENPKQSSSYARIINLKNHQRISRLVEKDKIYSGGNSQADDLYIEPTLMQGDWESPIMQQEIFGPVLPVFTFRNLDDVFKIINSKPKPLSAYLFSESKENQKSFVENVYFGGGCVNDVVVHFGNPYAPFGGVGDSGFGSYHGRNSFYTFSHAKTIMYRSGLLDLDVRYAPYSEKKVKFLRRIFGI